VLCQDVATEVALKIAPDGVDVVGVVLDVVVLDQEGGNLDSTVLDEARLSPSHPNRDAGIRRMSDRSSASWT